MRRHKNVLWIITALTFKGVLCDDVPPYPNPLFKGEYLAKFFQICTPEATEPCPLSSPTDFKRLYDAKNLIHEQVQYYRSFPRLVISCVLLSIIFIMMFHLAIIRHFDWRTLPIISFYFDIEVYQDKTNGVRYHQYVWMRYLVLRGNHISFRGRNYRDINWYKYNIDVNFDYKSVKSSRFIFLDKKMLTKHLTEDVEKDAAEVDILQPASYQPKQVI